MRPMHRDWRQEEYSSSRFRRTGVFLALVLAGVKAVGYQIL
jgi:hypothetical protein